MNLPWEGGSFSTPLTLTQAQENRVEESGPHLIILGVHSSSILEHIPYIEARALSTPTEGEQTFELWGQGSHTCTEV